MPPKQLSDQTLTTRQRCWASPRPLQLPDEAPAPGRRVGILGNWPAMRDPCSRSLAGPGQRLRLSGAGPLGRHPRLPCGDTPGALYAVGSAPRYVLPSMSVKPSGELVPSPSSGTAGWRTGHVHGGCEHAQGRPGGGVWDQGQQLWKGVHRGGVAAGPPGGADMPPHAPWGQQRG